MTLHRRRSRTSCNYFNKYINEYMNSSKFDDPHINMILMQYLYHLLNFYLHFSSAICRIYSLLISSTSFRMVCSPRAGWKGKAWYSLVQSVSIYDAVILQHLSSLSEIRHGNESCLEI
jgi:hypothetical protein